MLRQQSGPKAALRWVARLELEGTHGHPACHPGVSMGAPVPALLPRRRCSVQRVVSVLSGRWHTSSLLLTRLRRGRATVLTCACPVSCSDTPGAGAIGGVLSWGDGGRCAAVSLRLCAGGVGGRPENAFEPPVLQEGSWRRAAG